MMTTTPDVPRRRSSSDDEGDAPLRRFGRSFARHYLRPRFLLQTLGTLVAAYFLSRTLAKLSGSALWLPKGWRISMEVIATGVGFCAFAIAQAVGEGFHRRHRAAGSSHGAFEIVTASAAHAVDGASVLLLSVGGGTPPSVPAAAAARGAKADGERRAHRRRYTLSLCFTLAAFLCLIAYMGLRSRCVVGCDVRGWVATQERIAVAMNQRPDGAAPASHDAEDAAAQHEEEGGEEPRDGYSRIINVPDFMDPVRDEIYVPLFIPNDDGGKYVRSQGTLHDTNGLTYVLDHETDTVVDFLRRPWQAALFETTILFAVLHLLIMACVGAAAGFVDPLEKLAEAVGARH